MDDTRKTIYIEKPVDRAVIIFQNKGFVAMNSDEYKRIYESLYNQVRNGVVLLPNVIDCVGWVDPNGIVREETADCMPDTKEDW